MKPTQNTSSEHFAEAEAADRLAAEISEARSQIARRLGMGAVLIIVLLAILFFAENQMSWLSEFNSETAETQLARRAPPEDEKDLSQPVSAEAKSDAAVANAQPVAEPPPAPAEPSPTTPIAPAEAPKVAEAPAKPAAESAVETGKGRQGNVRTVSPERVVAERSTPRANLSAAIPLVPPASARKPVIAEAAPRAVPVRPVPANTPQAAPRLFSNFVVQAGVFSNYQKAQDVYTTLTQNGIPATLETRVQVGPFKNKAEADAAQAKIRSLGLEAMVLSPRK